MFQIGSAKFKQKNYKVVGTRLPMMNFSSELGVTEHIYSSFDSRGALISEIRIHWLLAWTSICFENNYSSNQLILICTCIKQLQNKKTITQLKIYIYIYIFYKVYINEVSNHKIYGTNESPLYDRDLDLWSKESVNKLPVYLRMVLGPSMYTLSMGVRYETIKLLSCRWFRHNFD